MRLDSSEKKSEEVLITDDQHQIELLHPGPNEFQLVTFKRCM